MDQTFDTGFQLHEGAVVGDVGDAAFVDRADGIHLLNSIPRIGLQLLHAQADAVGFLVDLDDLHLDGLTDRQDFRRVVDAAPRHVGDVQQAVHTAQINERTVFGDVLDHAVDGLTFGQVADDFSALFGTQFFQDRTTRDNDVATATVHLQDLERLLHAHQRASVAHGAHVNLAARQEGHGAAKVDREATLDPAKDRAIDARFGGIGFFQTIPGFFAAGLFTADLGFSAGVFHAVQINLDSVADVDVGLLTGVCEFLQVDAAFHLVADVDDGLACLDGDDPAFDDSALFGRVNFEAFLQKGFEFVHGCFSAHIDQLVLFMVFTGHAVGSAGLWIGPQRKSACPGKPGPAATPFGCRAYSPIAPCGQGKLARSAPRPTPGVDLIERTGKPARAPLSRQPGRARTGSGIRAEVAPR